MGDHLLPLARSHLGELVRETNGRDHLATVSRGEMYDEAETFVSYRLNALAAIRQTDRDARRMFLTDLMELGRMSFP